MRKPRTGKDIECGSLKQQLIYIIFCLFLEKICFILPYAYLYLYSCSMLLYSFVHGCLCHLKLIEINIGLYLYTIYVYKWSGWRDEFQPGCLSVFMSVQAVISVVSRSVCELYIYKIACSNQVTWVMSKLVQPLSFAPNIA